jgi:hypothetical protein
MLAERTMFSTIRTLPVARAVAGRRLFHASAPAFVKVGDKLPLMVLEAALFDSENVRRSRRILALVL